MHQPRPRSTLALVPILLPLLLLFQPAAAAPGDRRLELIEGADLLGDDYQTLKKLDLEACKGACLNDGRCQAFTYNTKARWCFLKRGSSEVRPFAGAVSGRIAGTAEPRPELEAQRLAELGFLPRATLEEARKVGRRILQSTGSPIQAPLDRLVAEAQAALGGAKPQAGLDLFAAALRMAPTSSGLWAQFAEAVLAAQTNDWRIQQRIREESLAAAVGAYLRAMTDAERARALALLGEALSERSAWRAAIRATRASLERVEDPEVRTRYETLLAEHGFRIREHRVDADAASPRVCIELSEPLPRNRPDLADFVAVEGGANLAVEVEPQQICIDGVEHGNRYRVRVRAGLPSAEGETLPKTVDLELYVRDRSPAVRFLGRAYVLPKGGNPSIPLVSVNTDRVEAQVYRLGDRSLARTLGDGDFLQQISEEEAQEIADRTGESVWKGSVEVEASPNREVTTAVPIGALIQDLKPGAYLMTARAHNAKPNESDSLATQWFVVSDLGLATFSGNDGLHTLVRSLSTARALGGVSLRLVAKNDEVLGRAVADDNGYARFEPGLLRGSGGNAPALLVAEGPEGDYGFLDLTKTPFDLSDRGVDGRPAPGPLDVYLVPERWVYRPGETVHLTALLRNATAHAVADLPLTLVVKRPDGVEHSRALAPDQGLGGHHLAVPLLRTAMRGTWRATAYLDPKAAPLSSTSFAVEDFEPERLTFELQSPVEALDPKQPPSLALAARYLYGVPAADLTLEGETLLKPSDSLPGFPGYRFGLSGEPVEPVREPLPAATTDAQGKAEVVLALPELIPTEKPLVAEINVRLAEGSGRPVERTLSLPVRSAQARIGIKPLFDQTVEEGGNAGFEVIAVGPDGQRLARQGLRWTLSRLQTSFQWYQTDGSWNYEPVTTRQRVASGEVTLGAEAPGRIEARVDWGSYALEVGLADGGLLPASLSFEAGWYLAPKAADTPDLLKVSLDKPRYRIGDTVQARLEPRFPGLALVMVVDDRLIAMQAVEVPAAGATVALPVTRDWGPGAYVTAVLYRPMDLGAKRMPGRAIGLGWAGVDPQTRKLDLQLTAPEKVDPRGPLEVSVGLGNLAAGDEAYVTLAAVDVGILNLTRYQAPDPDGWYFGQRRLGMEIRDLYGALIDRMQGAAGVVRSGGDGGLTRFEGPPPTEELVAFHSGILKLDAQGSARVSVDLPDFNGTVRLMAMAWSAAGVGHGVREVLVRDPVVVSAALPRFLAPGDQSRLLLDLVHTEGPAGEVQLAVQAEGAGVLLDLAAASQRLTLAEGGRTQVRVPLSAAVVGDHRLVVTLTTADGRVLRKRLRVAVRLNQPPLVRSEVLSLAPGAELRIGSERLGDLVPGSGSLLASATGAGPLDLVGLVRSLDRYPYGCAEQLTSRALPLLYLDAVALAAGLTGDQDVPTRIRRAIDEVLGNQTASGGFGLWGAQGESDLWLDAYVTDFLTRAREQGHPVPAIPFDLAIDNLRNQLAYAADFTSGGEGVAYALYTLARNGRALIGDLRYYAETKLSQFSTPLAKGQIGAALALYGERPRAERAFQAALVQWDQAEAQPERYSDFGSRLRDGAALLALAAESGVAGVDLGQLARRLADQRALKQLTSTQEEAWLLLAAHALAKGAAKPRLAIAGEVREGPFYQALEASGLAERPLSLANRGGRPLDVVVTIRGVPKPPPPAGGQGLSIERAYYDLEGRPVSPSQVAQGTRLVAILTVRAQETQSGRLILNDPLPAGLEIDNPNLIRAGDLRGLPWLDPLETTAHRAFLADRFVAAVDRTAEDPPQFQLAYGVRAVSPGRFSHPAATVEDMYRPERRGWTASGTVEVTDRAP